MSRIKIIKILKENIIEALYFLGILCISTAGFLTDIKIGFLSLGIMLVAVATLALGGLGMFAFGKLRKKKEDGIVEEGLEFADDSYINEDEENAEDQQK